MVKLGIDISAHQGNIDLETLHKNGVEFVIIRVGYGVSGNIDSKFKRNADLCKKLGIPFGFYWYSYALDVSGARKEAEHILNAIEPYKDSYSYGVWFDMEDADGYKSRNGMPSNQELRKMCAMFCKILEEEGYYAGVYASESWFKNQLNGSELNPYDKWIAQWPTSGGQQTALNTPSSKRSSSMWQFTSNAKFSGYSGNLDANYAYYDYPSLIGNVDNGAAEPSTPTDNTPTGSTLDLAYYVMKNGINGQDRKDYLGTRYDEVQDFINHIFSASVDTLVNEVIEGKYGNGETRKAVLDTRYNDVQNKINNSQSPSSSKTYTVKSGDTLSQIGEKLGVNWKTIAEKNNISYPYTIYPGQVLKY